MPADLPIKKLPKKVAIRGVSSNLYYSDEYVIATFYLQGKTGVAALTREIHLVDDLQANILIGADILTPEKIKLDYESQRIIIGSCQNLAVPFNSHARKDSNL